MPYPDKATGQNPPHALHPFVNFHRMQRSTPIGYRLSIYSGWFIEALTHKENRLFLDWIGKVREFDKQENSGSAGKHSRHASQARKSIMFESNSNNPNDKIIHSIFLVSTAVGLTDKAVGGLIYRDSLSLIDWPCFVPLNLLYTL